MYIPNDCHKLDTKNKVNLPRLPFQYLKESYHEKKRTDSLGGYVVIGQREMVSKLKKVDLGWI